MERRARTERGLQAELEGLGGAAAPAEETAAPRLAEVEVEPRVEAPPGGAADGDGRAAEAAANGGPAEPAIEEVAEAIEVAEESAPAESAPADPAPADPASADPAPKTGPALVAAGSLEAALDRLEGRIQLLLSRHRGLDERYRASRDEARALNERLARLTAGGGDAAALDARIRELTAENERLGAHAAFLEERIRGLHGRVRYITEG